MGRYIFDELVNECGITKIVQSALLGVGAAILVTAVSFVLLPNNPRTEYENKEND